MTNVSDPDSGRLDFGDRVDDEGRCVKCGEPPGCCVHITPHDIVAAQREAEGDGYRVIHSRIEPDPALVAVIGERDAKLLDGLDPDRVLPAEQEATAQRMAAIVRDFVERGQRAQEAVDDVLIVPELLDGGYPFATGMLYGAVLRALEILDGPAGESTSSMTPPTTHERIASRIVEARTLLRDALDVVRPTVEAERAKR